MILKSQSGVRRKKLWLLMVCLDLLQVFTIGQMFKAGQSEKRKV
ncbi:hypothetical protein [Escherichia coli IS35]|nr:hypothetical protein [Escherichia coli IS35]